MVRMESWIPFCVYFGIVFILEVDLYFGTPKNGKMDYQIGTEGVEFRNTDSLLEIIKAHIRIPNYCRYIYDYIWNSFGID